MMLNLKQKSYSHLLYRNGIVFALFFKKEMSHLKIKIGKIPNQNQQKSWTTLFFIFSVKFLDLNVIFTKDM